MGVNAEVLMVEFEALDVFSSAHSLPDLTLSEHPLHIQTATPAKTPSLLDSNLLERQLFTALSTCAQDSVYSNPVQRSLINSFLLQLSLNHQSVARRILQATDTSFSDKVSLFLDRRLDKEITLPMLAQHLTLSISSVKRKLAEEGLSFSQMLKQKRTYKGATILRSGRTNINTIAALCGFNSATQFSHAFKSVYGCTPKVFRRERRTP
ncbi:hypothetical protein VEZ01S_22_00330 [Vibrio ezurae NBRC 102218]|uniref:HTH araC/xylS-type domain-containing protein n=2 Tax=Vibrio ezurae TaxID=252583 RepID=U3AJC2_9VIBR|nr:hypothetical protein VEZ01S_22_00330 [Vibrio ezurae NBRC 102218]